eukprot:4686670-Pleurochrysis_carterae.AAC.1
MCSLPTSRPLSAGSASGLLTFLIPPSSPWLPPSPRPSPCRGSCPAPQAAPPALRVATLPVGVSPA